jgi:hypothetical protein
MARTYVVSEKENGGILSLCASATDDQMTSWRFRLQDAQRNVEEFCDSKPNGALDKFLSAKKDETMTSAGVRLLYKMAASIL